MTASPNPKLVNQVRPFQFFIEAFLAIQIAVDASDSVSNGACNQVSDHEPVGVVARVFAGSEAVDACHDVFTAELGIPSGDAFAFDDRVGVVFTESKENLN